jgi:hypothetical protein
MPARTTLAGVASALVVGLVYGYVAADLVHAPYYDPSYGSPGMVSFGYLALGVLAGLLLLPLLFWAVHALILRPAGMGAATGCTMVTIVAGIGAVAGFSLHAVLWPLPR